MILYNNRQVEFGRFPNGEVNLKKIEIYPEEINHVVTLKYEDDSDLFHLLLVRRALNVPVILRITYVPYSRMDRDNDTYIFSLKVFAEFINAMDWEKVVIYEPHSDVTSALFDRVQVINVTSSFRMLSRINNLALNSKYGATYQVCFPDIGAFKRYSEQIKTANPLYGIKFRDFETGKIIALDIVGNKELDTAVIFDDLCSKGGTFVLAAQRLREMGFKQIFLVVAHCEDTIYLGTVLDHIDKVITTDSIIKPVTVGAIEYQHKNKLEIIPLSDFRWN